ncbi:hypothetical protein J2Y55_003132 [Bosea sp. BE125]|nr:hypothetical protein [Bosea sp. BE125]
MTTASAEALIASAAGTEPVRDAPTTTLSGQRATRGSCSCSPAWQRLARWPSISSGRPFRRSVPSLQAPRRNAASCSAASSWRSRLSSLALVVRRPLRRKPVVPGGLAVCTRGGLAPHFQTLGLCLQADVPNGLPDFWSGPSAEIRAGVVRCASAASVTTGRGSAVRDSDCLDGYAPSGHRNWLPQALPVVGRVGRSSSRIFVSVPRPCSRGCPCGSR